MVLTPNWAAKIDMRVFLIVSKAAWVLTPAICTFISTVTGGRVDPGAADAMGDQVGHLEVGVKVGVLVVGLWVVHCATHPLSIDNRRRLVVVGPLEGLRDGDRDGDREGDKDGLSEGDKDGLREGDKDGLREGSDADGRMEGIVDGLVEGATDGLLVGISVDGEVEGPVLKGLSEGFCVGLELMHAS